MADERAIRARLAAATRGPWVLGGGWGYIMSGVPQNEAEAEEMMVGQCFDGYQNDYPNAAANQEFIAHSPTDVAALLALLDAARAEREAAQQVLADLTRDRWAGWGANDREDRWVCFWCNADSGDDTDMNADDAPQHKPDCPMALAAALVWGGGEG